MNRTLHMTLVIVAMLLSCGCATGQRLQPAYQPGAVLDTLSAAASLSISRGEQGMAGNGYLLYQRPDRMRLVIMSPFGTTLLELFVAGEQVTIVDTSRGVAFSGLLADLPTTGEGATWRHIRWVMELERPDSPVHSGVLERTDRNGNPERVTLEDGLVVAKSRASGDMVRYNDYSAVNGVPLAAEIIVDSHDGGRFHVRLSEPEVNAALAPETFVPKLDGLKVYPLTLLQGQ